jgi:hypothetical protein
MCITTLRYDVANNMIYTNYDEEDNFMSKTMMGPKVLALVNFLFICMILVFQIKKLNIYFELVSV